MAKAIQNMVDNKGPYHNLFVCLSLRAILRNVIRNLKDIDREFYGLTRTAHQYSTFMSVCPFHTRHRLSRGL